MQRPAKITKYGKETKLIYRKVQRTTRIVRKTSKKLSSTDTLLACLSAQRPAISGLATIRLLALSISSDMQTAKETLSPYCYSNFQHFVNNDGMFYVTTLLFLTANVFFLLFLLLMYSTPFVILFILKSVAETKDNLIEYLPHVIQTILNRSASITITTKMFFDSKLCSRLY